MEIENEASEKEKCGSQCHISAAVARFERKRILKRKQQREKPEITGKKLNKIIGFV